MPGPAALVVIGTVVLVNIVWILSMFVGVGDIPQSALNPWTGVAFDVVLFLLYADNQSSCGVFTPLITPYKYGWPSQ